MNALRVRSPEWQGPFHEEVLNAFLSNALFFGVSIFRAVRHAKPGETELTNTPDL
jgi:hypothetical protein